MVRLSLARLTPGVDTASSHDAVRKAVAFFLDPFWKGPQPKAGTVLRVCPMGGKEIRARVSAENCGALPAGTDAHFDHRRECYTPNRERGNPWTTTESSECQS